MATDTAIAQEQDVARPTGVAEARTGVARLRAVLLLTPFLVLIDLTFFFAQTDPDYWWHARTGQLIRETGRLPRTDPFSFTSADKPWVTHEWLTEVIFSAIASRFGYVGNVVVCGLVAALTALMVWATCRRRELGAQGATLLTLWAFAIMLPLMNVRPQLVTMLCLAICAFLITGYLGGATRLLWFLPPIFTLWVNLHGGYVIGLVLLGLTVAGETVAVFLRREAALRPLLLATAASGAATLLNPHGVEALRYPFSYAGTGNASQRFIAEWQSPDFHQAAFLPFAASLLIGLLTGRGRAAWRPTETLWMAVFTLLALQSIRHMPLYAIVVLPLIGTRLRQLNLRWPQLLAHWRGPVGIIVPACGWFFLLVAMAALLTGGTTLHLQTGREPRATGYPEGAVAYLHAHPEEQGRLFNTYAWGGYLIAQLYPERLVSIDGRADVHGDALVTRHRATERLGPDWRTTLDEWRIGLVLVDKDGPLATALRDDPDWRELFVGDVERLFARREAGR